MFDTACLVHRVLYFLRLIGLIFSSFSIGGSFRCYPVQSQYIEPAQLFCSCVFTGMPSFLIAVICTVDFVLPYVTVSAKTSLVRTKI